MKKTRYSDEQIIRILRETDTDTVAEVSTHNSVSEATTYEWRKKFSGMKVDEVKWPKAPDTRISKPQRVSVCLAALFEAVACSRPPDAG